MKKKISKSASERFEYVCDLGVCGVVARRALLRIALAPTNVQWQCSEEPCASFELSSSQKCLPSQIDAVVGGRLPQLRIIPQPRPLAGNVDVRRWEHAG